MIGPSGPRHLAGTSRHMAAPVHCYVGSEADLRDRRLGWPGASSEHRKVKTPRIATLQFGLVTGDEVGHGIQLAGWALLLSPADCVVETGL